MIFFPDCNNSNCSSINKGIDKCIQPFVKALNDAGYETIASCCGHRNLPTRITLKSGEEIFIAKDYETAQKISHSFGSDIHGNKFEFNKVKDMTHETGISLEEYCAELPANHRVNKELEALLDYSKRQAKAAKELQDQCASLQLGWNRLHERNRELAKGISITGAQIKAMAEYAGYVVSNDEECDETDFTLDTSVLVDGAEQKFYLYCTEYPEEGGSTLKTARKEVTQEQTND